MPLHGEAARRPTYHNLTPVTPGQSETYFADHEIFGVPVVQKIVPESATVTDAVVLQEPRLLKDLDHPAIPKIYEAQFDPKRPHCVAMVMEKVGEVDGGAVVLGKAPPLSVGEGVAVALDLLGALHHLHVSAGVVQRDIKPDNIRLSSDRCRAWLIDFNVAGRLRSDGTVDGVATPVPWMAPEVPSDRYSVRSELFSLGVVLYELLRGRQMLADYTQEKAEKRVTSGLRAFPNTHYRRWPPHVSDGLRRVINKALRQEPSDRWRSAAEMRRAVGRLVYVDWHQDPTDPNRWLGTWPSTRDTSERIDVEVTVRTLKGGPDRGKLRAVARYRPGTSWRRLAGFDDRTLDPDADLSQFFDDVDKHLASLRPTS